MKLIVHELEDDGLVQAISTPDRNINVVAIRPHLYRHAQPVGNLRIQILDADDILLVESEELTISDIGSDTYFHGYTRFFLNVSLMKNTVYKIKLIGTGGYSFNESSYVGWCNGFDLGKYSDTYSPIGQFSKSLDFEVWERTNK